MTTVAAVALLIGALTLLLLVAIVGWVRSSRRQGSAETSELAHRVDRAAQEGIRDAMAQERDGRASDNLRRFRQRRVRDEAE